MPEHDQDLALLLEATTPGEAALARGLLEPEGIPCLVEGRAGGDVAQYELHRVSRQIRPDVYVPRALEERARALLEAAWGTAPQSRLPAAPAVGPRVTLAFLAICLLTLFGLLVWVNR